MARKPAAKAAKASYKQLDRETERELLLRFQATGDAEAASRLFEAQRGWSEKLAKEFCSRHGWWDIETAVAAAYLGVFESMRRFDPARSNRLSTVVWFGVQNVLRRDYAARGFIHVADNAHDKEAAGLTRRPTDPECVTALVWPETDYDECQFSTEEFDRVERAMSRLETRERWILEQRLMYGKTLVQVGAQLGVTKERVRQIQIKATRRLRVVLGLEQDSSRASAETEVLRWQIVQHLETHGPSTHDEIAKGIGRNWQSVRTSLRTLTLGPVERSAEQLYSIRELEAVSA